MSSCNVILTIISTLVGGVLSFFGSRSVAGDYFRRQRKIDSQKEENEVELASIRLTNAYFRMYGKRRKSHPVVRDAMTEFEAKLKIYRPEWDAPKMMAEIGKAAKEFIDNNPDSFEDDV